MADSAGRLDTLTVALLEPVSLGNALSPANDSERLLFRNLSNNLIRLDCQGAVRPGLAESWTPDSDGRGWVLTLREGAIFPAAEPMSASEVVGGFRVLTLTDSASVRALGIDSAIGLDQRHLRVRMRASVRDSLPRFLADPALALVDGLASAGVTGEGNLAIPRRGSLPVIDFRFSLEPDARDALDRDVDLVVTRDPMLVDYVTGRPQFVTFPLPWSRSYVLLQPAAAQALEVPREGSERRSLARDAVRGDARAAEPLSWWNEAAACPRSPLSPSTPPSSRVAYVRGDEVGRELAERIVALAGSESGLRTAALEPGEFVAALRNGSEVAYVTALPRQTLAPCREAAAFPEGARVQPLIDTRAHVILRKGAPPLTVEWDGTVRVVEP